MLLDKAELIRRLETVMGGTTYREESEQSSCIVFQDNWMMTYNDEIACLAPIKHEFEGAVPAVPFLRTVKRMRADEIEIVQKKSVIKIQSGKNQSAEIKMESEIELPMDLFKRIIQGAGTWCPLSRGITNGIQLAYDCASNDASQRKSTCVHFHPNYIEATDNYQAGRYSAKKTGFTQSVMMEKLTVGHLIKFRPCDVCQSNKAWVYFKNESGSIMACRKVAEDPLDLDHYFKLKGELVALPEGLSDCIDAAAEMTAESEDNDMLLLAVRRNLLIVKGQGKFGWYRERIKTNYRGRELSFYIAPGIVRNLYKHHKECKLSDKFLIAKSKQFHFVTRISKDDDDE